MVGSFRFGRVPLILFKRGKISELPSYIKDYGKNVVLVTGRKSFVKSIQGELFLNDLNTNGFRVHHIVVSSEPSPQIVDDAVKSSRKITPDVVVAIGGGSVIDAGKAISAMLPLELPIKRYLEGIGSMVHPGDKIPFIAVPTTSGTGSEATKNAVISETGINGFKKSLRHENFVPDIALIDPELTLTCSADLTAASGMDCFTQLTEAFLSTKSNIYTDALALEGLKFIKTCLMQSYKNGQNYEAREGMSFAALTSGICLANAGLGVVHGFASSIGGQYNIPHGVICGTLMAISNEVIVRKLRKYSGNTSALNKYVKLGQLFLFEKGKSGEFYIDGFINYLHSLTQELNLPGLKQSGLEESNIEQICRETENKNNPVKLDFEDMMEILSSRYF